MKRISLLILCLALLSPRARADGSQVAAAEALFNEGRRLKDAGDYDRACPMLAESQRLDPGTGTLLNLATCYEEAGKKASAWAAWIEAQRSARAAGQSDRESHARERAAALDKEMARLTIEVSSDAPARVSITRGDEPVARAIWGSAIPVDSGEYSVVAAAPGYQNWTQRIRVADGQNQVVTISALVPSAEDQSTASPSTSLSTASPPGAEESTASSTQKTWGYVAGGLGIAGLGASGVFAILALDKNNQSKLDCDPDDPNLCTQDGFNARNAAFGMGTASTVAFGVGAAALATGIVLVLTAPSSSTQVSAGPLPGGGSITVRGNF